LINETYNKLISTRYARREEGFTLIHYVVYVFCTDMNYAKGIINALFCFAVEMYLYNFFNNMQYVLKCAAPISKCFRRPCSRLSMTHSNSLHSTCIKEIGLQLLGAFSDFPLPLYMGMIMLVFHASGIYSCFMMELKRVVIATVLCANYRCRRFLAPFAFSACW